jgi:helix-turn-helix protein
MTGLRPQKLDVLLAFKAIALTDELSGMEKRVAAAIVDSFNYRTTQCDPSLNRIAHLLGASRRTVIRAVIHLEHLRFMRKHRHGGHSHRNSYEPNWIRYREIEGAWAAHKRTKHWKSSVTETSPCRSQTSHLDGANDGTQTSLINKFELTNCVRPKPEAANASPPRKRAADRLQFKPPIREGTRPLQAATTAAERRWSTDLTQQFASDPETHAKIIGAIDASLQDKATQAELHKRGAGLELILRDVRRQLGAETASHD